MDDLVCLVVAAGLLTIAGQVAEFLVEMLYRRYP